MNYRRVTKPTARRMYLSGCEIMLLPCKVGSVHLEDNSNPWVVRPVTISLATCPHDANRFDRSVNDFEYYNCNAELGYYAHYFVTEEEFEKYNMCKLMCNQGGN